MACPSCLRAIPVVGADADMSIPDWAYALPGGAPVAEGDPWYLRVNWDQLFKSGLYVYDEVAKRYAAQQAGLWAQRGFMQPTQSLLSNPLTWVAIVGGVILLATRK